MTKKFTLFIVFLLCSFGIAMAQDITIKGEVKDQQGLPLPGVSVKVKGTSQGAMTGANGSFLLKAPADATLTFSFIGYKTTEQAVAGKTTLNVTLTDDNNQLNEVVVVGYGTKPKKT